MQHQKCIYEYLHDTEIETPRCNTLRFLRKVVLTHIGIINRDKKVCSPGYTVSSAPMFQLVMMLKIKHTADSRDPKVKARYNTEAKHGV